MPREIKIAKSSFSKGCNCAQSLLLGFSGRTGLETEVSMSLGRAFGGGLGRRGETCGTVVGALMVLGLALKDEGLSEKAKDVKVRELGNRFLDLFLSRQGKTHPTCRQLLGRDLSKPGEYMKASVSGRFTKVCTPIVETAATLVLELLESKE